MSFIIQSILVGDKEQEFRNKYPRYHLIKTGYEGATECYSIESDSGEMDFGLVVEISITAVKPKALFAQKYRTLFVGFDSFVATVPIIKSPLTAIEHQLLRT